MLVQLQTASPPPQLMIFNKNVSLISIIFSIFLLHFFLLYLVTQIYLGCKELNFVSVFVSHVRATRTACLMFLYSIALTFIGSKGNKILCTFLIARVRSSCLVHHFLLWLYFPNISTVKEIQNFV
jgi:hypothetical protein